MSTITTDAIREIEDETKTTLPDAMASYLQATLGQKMAAYLAGVNDSRMVGRWARGIHEPRGPARMRLQTAFEVTKLLSSAYNAETAKTWLIGSNSRMDDEAPAYLIRHADSVDDLRLIVPTARAFAGGRG